MKNMNNKNIEIRKNLKKNKKNKIILYIQYCKC